MVKYRICELYSQAEVKFVITAKKMSKNRVSSNRVRQYGDTQVRDYEKCTNPAPQNAFLGVITNYIFRFLI